MSNLLFQTIDQISREKGIDPQIVIHAIEDAIVVASRKYFKSNEELRGRINSETGEIDIFAIRKVVDNVTNSVREISLDEARTVKPDAQLDEEIEFQKPAATLGRIAAQMAKQVIFQKVREAERESVYAEYHKHVGEVVNCVVKRFENGDIIVELGKTEGKLPKREQSRLESFSVSDRIRVIIIKVEKTSKGPQVIVSRTDPSLVQHLFQTEVPEIYDGTVQIKHIAREAGERTKIAVSSREKDVDPVGACVGMKGTRVQSIIRELRGEKIDIIPWNEDVTIFVRSALAPAEISMVRVIPATNTLEIIVEDDQLSLAIGKKGQNVRLASQLTGWKVDIISRTKLQTRTQDALKNLKNIDGLTDTLAQSIYQCGFLSVAAVAKQTIETLARIPGFDTEGAAEELNKKAQDAAEKLGPVLAAGIPSVDTRPNNNAAKADADARLKEALSKQGENK